MRTSDAGKPERTADELRPIVRLSQLRGEIFQVEAMIARGGETWKA